MNDDELKELWRGSSSTVHTDTPRLTEDIARKLASFERDLRRRDRREIVAAALLIPAFAAMTLLMPQVAARIGAALGLISAAACIIILHRAARKKPVDASMPSKQYLQQIRDYTLHQQQLLNTAHWWYALPFTVSCSLIFAAFHWWYGVLVAFAVGVVVVWVNKRTANSYFGPLLREINQELATLDDGDTDV